MSRHAALGGLGIAIGRGALRQVVENDRESPVSFDARLSVTDVRIRSDVFSQGPP
jgi:hypothetical protein